MASKEQRGAGEHDLPPRYEKASLLGKGGGGEVWEVRDRVTGARLALKTLRPDAHEAEMMALVREAAALGGLEGLGVPKVLRFGRFSGSGRPFFVRELVDGRSLDRTDLEGDGLRLSLAAIARVADDLTALHRAAVFHGDIKPANVIVDVVDDKRVRATLVDFGLAVVKTGDNRRPFGLTPDFAAPELLAGSDLSVRTEVYALGATLGHVLDRAGERGVDPTLRAIVARATAQAPQERFPSTDELASTLRLRAALGDDGRRTRAENAWPIVGIDDVAHDFLAFVGELGAGGGAVLAGPRGSGRTTLLKRTVWSLGVRGERVVWLEPAHAENAGRALDLELEGAGERPVVVVDDAERLSPEVLVRIGALRDAGSRIVVSASAQGDRARGLDLPGPTLQIFTMPRLADRHARDLATRAIVSLEPDAVERVVAIADGVPGRLRAVLARLGGAPIVSPADVDRLTRGLEDGDVDAEASATPAAALSALRAALDRGHFEEAQDRLAPFEGEDSLALAIARARLFTNRGDAQRAIETLVPHETDLGAATARDRAEWFLHLARAHLRLGDYPRSEQVARVSIDGALAADTDARGVVAETRSVVGLALSFQGRHDEALGCLLEAVEEAEAIADPRLASVTLGSLAFAYQRVDDLAKAETTYEQALKAAGEAGDAGSVATTRLNLASIAQRRDDLALALSHLEAAVDMGRRSGRLSTLRQALLNLASLDLYLGRLARAQVSLDALNADRDDLPPQSIAQLLALEGEAASKSNDFGRAAELCAASSAAYEALGRPIDAAEARLERILFALADPAAELATLRRELAAAEKQLDGTGAHVALVDVVRARLAKRAGDPEEAKAALDRAIENERRSGLREWLWRALELRAALAQENGQTLAARRDREAAVTVLEENAAKLPRDLREVYWNDPRRRALRGMTDTFAIEAAAHVQTVGQDKLARVLEVNREIAGTYDLRRLLERVTDHAIALLSAERGFVIMKSSRAGAEREDGSLSVHASRSQEGDDSHARFSQSIADKVIFTGEPVVTTSARNDARMADYVSVHQLMLQSVACVPIRSRSSGVIGALYLETRLRAATSFAEEMPILTALADQVAIAIETARLVGENERRAQELSRANQELMVAREKLEELLGHRTAQLAATRRDLRSARAVLKSHFGYEGLVGTSEAMRRVYALVERIKDTDVPVLVTGESGTGKEVIARAIHNAGPRAKKTFVGINCGAIPEHLLESELFGHMKGAFTGADRDRKGLFREATEGSVLLDEIGEMPHKMQAGLLRVLQEKVVRPVGGAREEPVDTRVIAATHRDLATMVAAGTFREDLYYRLNVINVRVPPLRERLEDIPTLIDHFLGIFAARYNRERRSVSRSALKMLTAFKWPGNVRQLENVLLNAWVLSEGAELEVEDFEIAQERPATMSPPIPPASRRTDVPKTNLDEHRDEEKTRILHALTSSGWNRVKAAEIIGMPRRTFYRRLKDYGIQ